MVLPLPGGTQQPGFQIFQIDTTLLGAAANASIALRTVGSIPQSQLPSINSQPAIEAPWELEGEPETLVRRISQVRNREQFIDLNSEAAARAGDDIDARATFALFEALRDLETLAEFASETATPESALGALDERFQAGLAEVESFLRDTELDRLDLLFGEKLNRVESRLRTGRNSIDYQGGAIQEDGRFSSVAGLTRDQGLVITLEKFGNTDVLDIDFDTLPPTIALDDVVDLVNARISEIPDIDTDGNVRLDDDGEVIPRYSTRFGVFRTDNGDYGIEIDGSSTEDVKLAGKDAQPTIYVANTVTNTLGNPTTGQLARVSPTDAGAIQDRDLLIAGVDPAVAALAEEVALSNADGDDEIDTEGFGAVETTARQVAVDSEGNVYVLGQTDGTIDGRDAAGPGDIYLTKFDSRGEILFSRFVGAGTGGEAGALVIDDEDNVVIAGQANRPVNANDTFSGPDSFVIKYNSSGEEIFSYQLDRLGEDRALALAVDDNGDVIVGGEIERTISASTVSSGGDDAFIIRLNGQTGTVEASSQFGTAAGDRVEAIAFDGEGNLLVATSEAGNAIVRRFAGGDVTIASETISLGSLGGGRIEGIAVAPAADGTGPGELVIVGNTQRALSDPGAATLGSYQGGGDGFVTRVALGAEGGSSSIAGTQYIGGTSGDRLTGLAVDGDNIYLAGRTGGLNFADGTAVGKGAFAVQIDRVSGEVGFAQTLRADDAGTGSTIQAQSIAFGSTGSKTLDLLGLKSGTVAVKEPRDITDQGAVRDGDFFYISVDGGRPRKIEIEDGDDFRSIVTQINTISLTDLRAEEVISSNGRGLKITALSDKSIDILAGEAGRDALAGLGLEPTRLLSADELFGIGEDSDDQSPSSELGGSFALGLD
ncbi:MAG: SBBP repeat-containing protein, partial [Pseudomonadota bacterium]